MAKFFEQIYRFLCSLKLAVIVILGLTLSLIVATVLESTHDTATAQYYVYRTLWFYSLLGLLGTNILVVAISRYPWKKHHAAFLCAHAGILCLLFGAWITYRFGLDGTLRIEEGTASGTVEINDPRIVLVDGESIRVIPVPWHPPQARFSKIAIPEFNLTVDQYISHAIPEFEFVNSDSDPTSKPALGIEISGGPMRIRQKYWLWAGQESFTEVQAGPAKLFLDSDASNGVGKDVLTTPTVGKKVSKKKSASEYTGPYLRFEWNLQSSKQFKVYGRGQKALPNKLPEQLGDKVGDKQGDEAVLLFETSDDEVAKRVEPIELEVEKAGWKKGVRVKVFAVYPKAAPVTRYVPSPSQFGAAAPPSAIHLVSGSGGEGAELWLGLGDRANLQYENRTVMVAYQLHRLQLPFQLQLEKFNIEYYTGSRSPKSYASDVTIQDDSLEQSGTSPGTNKVDSAEADSKVITISMNEPLTHKGITFYQSSYEDKEPRPTVSIFSVNQDPGRFLKYMGSLLLVLGCILLFANRWKKARAMQEYRVL